MAGQNRLSRKELSRKWNSLSGFEKKRLGVRNAVTMKDATACDKTPFMSFRELVRDFSPYAVYEILKELANL
jgi:hypothetical protein